MSNYNKDEEKRTPLLGSNYAHFCVYIETINVNGGSERECWILLSFNSVVSRRERSSHPHEYRAMNSFELF